MKAVLAYSGGLDTSAIIPWLIEVHDCEVIAVVGDVGQGAAELQGIEEKARRSGASACYVVDLKRELLEQFAYPTLLAGAVYEGRYLLGTAIARPALARAQARVALDVGADALVHGCTGKGNDQVRFETVYARFAPHMKVIAPWREWTMRSREELLAYIEARGIPCTASVEKIYSRDANLWHISHEGGDLEDPWAAPPADVWMRTADPVAAPDAPEDVLIGFEHGRPCAVNGQALSPVELVTALNEIGGRHGVGRVDLVESRLVGMKSRGCYESPGPHVLNEALRSLEEIVFDRATLHYREQIGLKFAELVYDGQWFTPLREALSACFDSMAQRLTGEVCVRLYKGGAIPVQRRAEASLYSAELATFGADEVYDQSHAEGFIRLFSLPSRAAALKLSGARRGARLMALWGGRFESAADPLFKEINDSLRIDSRLVHEDIEGSVAWANALGAAEVLSGDEVQQLVTALQSLSREIRTTPQSVRNADDEDVHAWVERQLIARVGDLGKKLHTGRSRNDQVATDLRLWTRRAIGERCREIEAARRALLRLAERERDTIIPGYTHLQRAQPVLLAHWALAYNEMLVRDAARFADAARRLNECPLGAGALAGTAYPIDRTALATSLGFDRPTANSLDTVADRDFVVETIGAATLCSAHLGRLAEDLIFFNSGEAGFIELADAVTSGSSLMPQKKNPDALELLRAKTGRILGSFVTTTVMLKGLSLAYNKDLQEDKEPLFDAMDAISQCLRILPAILDGMLVHRERTRAAAEAGYANATELADYLVGKGVAFRDAHDAVGRIVRHALERGVALDALDLDAFRQFASDIEDDVYECLTLDSLLARRDVIGGTAPGRVHAAIDAATARLGNEPADASSSRELL